MIIKYTFTTEKDSGTNASISLNYVNLINKNANKNSGKVFSKAVMYSAS